MAGNFGKGAAWRLGSMVVAATALAILASGACRGKDTGAGNAGGAGAGGRIGGAVTDLRFVDLDGREHTSASLQGKLVMVDFWDTWCGPCLRALPHLKELGEAHEGRLVVVAVAIGQEGEAKVREVVARQALPFPVVMHGAQGDLVPAFGEVSALPTTFLLDQQGVIRQRWVEAQSPSTYARAVSDLLGS